jgi:nucleoside-diphosphate-sugar epimerase
MEILVTGGSGFLGTPLVQALQKKGHRVTVLDQAASRVADDSIVGSLLDEATLAKVRARKFGAVYHLAAVLDEASPALRQVNVEGTRLLLEACKDMQLERFIFTSPIGVLGESSRPLREDDAYNPETPYEKSKAEAEHIVTNYFLRHRMPYTIVRMTIVYGPNDFWRQILEAARKKFPIIGSGKNQWHLLYVDDAVQALVLALGPKAKNQIYNIAGPDSHTYEETYKIIAKAIGSRPPSRRVPVEVAKAGALLHELQSKVKGERPKVTLMRASIDRLVRNRVVDIGKACHELGFAPTFTLEKGMARTAKALGFAKR